MIGRARGIESEKTVEPGKTWFWVSQELHGMKLKDELHGMKLKDECRVFPQSWRE